MLVSQNCHGLSGVSWRGANQLSGISRRPAFTVLLLYSHSNMNAILRVSHLPQLRLARTQARNGLRSLQLSSSSTSRYSEQLLPGEQPPIVIPSHTHTPGPHPSSSPTAGSSKLPPSILPQQGSVAGPRPPAPSPEKPLRKAPTLKASKAAITLVRGL